jgi:hypothetical protein
MRFGWLQLQGGCMSFLAPDFGSQNRKVLVTPSFFPTGGNFRGFEPLPRVAELFPKSKVSDCGFEPKLLGDVQTSLTHAQTFGHIDWITIRQSHHNLTERLPLISNGCVMAFDADGAVENTTLKRMPVVGSYESKCFVRCDGDTVEFSGNPARWGRMDNVFGYSLGQSLQIVNEIIGGLGLPPFSPGDSFETVKKGGEIVRVWTGATVSRLDMTENYLTGSPENANHFLRWLAGQKIKSKKTNFYGDHSTVDFGRGSKRSYFKVYNKGYELLKHSKGISDISTFEKQDRCESIEKIADWCQVNGMVRAELELKSKALHDLHCYYLGELDMNVIELEFKKHSSVFERATAEVDSLASLEAKTLAVYRMWQAGDDVKNKFSKSAIYRHRSALLAHGIDIFIPSNVIRFEPKTRVIALTAAIPPDWYQLPSVGTLRAA